MSLVRHVNSCPVKHFRFRDSALAHRYLDGLDGIEIGAAAHNPFNVRGKCTFVDVGNPPAAIYQEEQRRFCGEVAKVDVVAPADRLPFADGSVGYVLTSHVLEHVWDVIGCLIEWDRVLAVRGFIFAIVPHKERTSDRDRPVTTPAELSARHCGALSKPAGSADQHWSVWRTADFLDVIAHMAARHGVHWDLCAVQDTDDKVGNGFAVVIAKIAAKSD